MRRRDFLYNSAALLAAGAVGGSAGVSPAFAQPAGRKVRVGLLGVSHSHAAGKLAAVQKLSDDFELIGVAEPDAELKQSLQSHPKYRSVRWLSEQELLSAPGLDAAIIETEVRDLAPAAQRCIESGLHVHLEKPGGESHAAYVRLFDAALRRGKLIQTGYMLRYNPSFEFCIRAVREGWLGQIHEVDGAMSKLLEDKQRKELVPYGGGAMFELGSHLIDMLLTLLGPPQKVTPYGRRTRPEQDQLLDCQLAVFDYPTAAATIRSSFVEANGQEHRHFKISGANGVIEIRPLEPPQLRLTLVNPAGEFAAGEHEVKLPEAEGRYDAQLRDFAAIIRGERKPRWTGQHDVNVHRAVLEASGLPTDS